jgi:hypothetical protein
MIFSLYILNDLFLPMNSRQESPEKRMIKKRWHMWSYLTSFIAHFSFVRMCVCLFVCILETYTCPLRGMILSWHFFKSFLYHESQYQLVLLVSVNSHSCPKARDAFHYHHRHIIILVTLLFVLISNDNVTRIMIWRWW